jgi:hypothetical protein
VPYAREDAFRIKWASKEPESQAMQETKDAPQAKLLQNVTHLM